MCREHGSGSQLIFLQQISLHKFIGLPLSLCLVMCIRAANEGNDFGAFFNVYEFLRSSQRSTSRTSAACLSRRIGWFIVQPNADSFYWLAKGEVPVHAVKAYGGEELYLQAFLTLALDGTEWSKSLSGRCTYWVGDWVVPARCLEILEKRIICYPIGNHF